MERTAARRPGRVAFNYDLFVIDDKPLEFHICGFDHVQSSKIAKIVEAFGGKLSCMRSPYTTVFVNPEDISQRSSNYYDVKFLEDSIVAQRFLNLEDYRIPLTVVPESTSHQDTNVFEEPTSNLEIACDDTPDDKTYRNIDEMECMPSKHAEQEEELRQDPRMIISSIIHSYRPEDRDYPKRKKESEYEHSPSQSSKCSNYSSSNEDCHEHEPKKQPRKKRICTTYHKYTREEDHGILQFIIDKSALNRVKNEEIWNEILATEILAAPKPTASGVYQHFRKKLIKKYWKFARDRSVQLQSQ